MQSSGTTTGAAAAGCGSACGVGPACLRGFHVSRAQGRLSAACLSASVHHPCGRKTPVETAHGPPPGWWCGCEIKSRTVGWTPTGRRTRGLHGAAAEPRAASAGASTIRRPPGRRAHRPRWPIRPRQPNRHRSSAVKLLTASLLLLSSVLRSSPLSSLLSPP